MRFLQPAWYRAAEQRLEVAWPLEVGLAVVVVGVTALLVVTRKRLALAAWLVYLFMP